MIHKKFYEFITEKTILKDMILESVLNFSQNFTSILNSIKDDDRVAREILTAFQTAKDAQYIANYIDLAKDQKEYIQYIPQSKANTILAQTNQIWKINNTSKFLTFKKTEDGEYTNSGTFRRLNYTPSESDISTNVEVGTLCQISNRCINPSGKEYALISLGEVKGKEFIQSGIQKVININGLEPYDDRYERLWSEQRASFKVGKFAKSVLDALNISYTPQEIEEFSRKYKAGWDIFNEGFGKFDIVSGKDIAFWYKSSNYENQKSTLGNSCMKEKGSDYFEIYIKNPEVCQMIILYNDNGRIVDGKYKSNKIKARAILWTLDDGTMFMDRIYTNDDSDTELFKQFAQSKGWFYKNSQDSDSNFYITNGIKKLKKSVFRCNIKIGEFSKYPYIDSMKYLSLSDMCLTNLRIESSERLLSCTYGDWYTVEDED